MCHKGESHMEVKKKHTHTKLEISVLIVLIIQMKTEQAGRHRGFRTARSSQGTQRKRFMCMNRPGTDCVLTVNSVQPGETRGAASGLLSPGGKLERGEGTPWGDVDCWRGSRGTWERLLEPGFPNFTALTQESYSNANFDSAILE